MENRNTTIRRKVEYKRKSNNKLAQRWRPGIFLGIRRLTSEKIVGDTDGIFVVVSVRRVPEEERWDAGLLNSIKGTPWQPSPEAGEPTELPEPVVIHPERPDVAAEATVPAEKASTFRKIYITARDLQTYGYTQGCPACNSSRAGKRLQGTMHTAQCRKRLEEKILEQEPERVQRYYERFAEAPGEHPERQLQRDEDERPGPASKRVRVEGPDQPPPDTPDPDRVEGPDQPPPDTPDPDQPRGQKRRDDGEAEDEQPPEKRRAMLLEAAGGDEDYSLDLLVQEVHDRRVQDILSLQKGSPYPVCEEVAIWEDPGYIEEFYDETSGVKLNPKLVAEARKAEIEFIDAMGVWEVGPRPPKGSSTKVVKGRWVDVDKGDRYRSRYVACEIKGGVKTAFVSDFFAAMPPLSSSKFLCILAVTERFPDRLGNMIRMQDKTILFVDVKRAHFVSMARRDIAVELPPDTSSKPCMARGTQRRVGELKLREFSWTFWVSNRDVRIRVTSSTPNAISGHPSMVMMWRPWAHTKICAGFEMSLKGLGSSRFVGFWDHQEEQEQCK